MPREHRFVISAVRGSTRFFFTNDGHVSDNIQEASKFQSEVLAVRQAQLLAEQAGWHGFDWTATPLTSQP